MDVESRRLIEKLGSIALIVEKSGQVATFRTTLGF